jgi:hypothetical protein
MLDYALVQAILRGADGSWPVSGALLIFSGLLSPLEPKARALRGMRRAVRPSQEASPNAGVGGDRVETSATSLNAIELALIAELNLEQARAHDEVANDAARRPEVRLAAEAYATAWRERAGLFRLEAQRRSGHPMVPGRSARVRASTYTGPERRRQMRRRQTRRGDGEAASERPDRRDRRDRRTRPERRGFDRRVPEPAAL